MRSRADVDKRLHSGAIPPNWLPFLWLTTFNALYRTRENGMEGRGREGSGGEARKEGGVYGRQGRKRGVYIEVAKGCVE